MPVDVLGLVPGVGVVAAEAMPVTPRPRPRASAAAEMPKVMFLVRVNVPSPHFCRANGLKLVRIISPAYCNRVVRTSVDPVHKLSLTCESRLRGRPGAYTSRPWERAGRQNVMGRGMGSPPRIQGMATGQMDQTIAADKGSGDPT